MSSIRTRVCSVCLTALMLPTVAGCMSVGERVPVVDLRTESKTVALGDAREVLVIVDMGVGECTVSGGSDALLDAEFTYNVEEWQPAVEYTVSDGRGRLTITQPDAKGKSVSGDAKNTWKLRLSNDVPLELMVDTGAGEATLDLGDLQLKDLQVDHGVGELSVYLVGDGITDLSGSIDGGVGKLRVVVPNGVGVRVNADTGIGELRAIGLAERDGYLVNEAYGSSGHTIDLKIDAGVGTITVEASDTRSVSM